MSALARRTNPLLGFMALPFVGPAHAPGLTHWYRADLGTWQDSAGTVTAAADGDPVGRWTNQANSAQWYQQVTAAKRSIVKLSIAGGRPFLRFDGVDDFLVRGDATAGISGPRTFFLVIANPNVGANGIIAASGRTAGNAGSWEITTDYRSYTGFDDSVSSFSTQSWATAQPTAPYILCIRQSSADSQFYVNGGTPVTVARIVTAFTTCIKELGATDNGNAQNASVDIGEVLGYTGALAASDIYRVNKYLGGRYGIAVS